jgi:hypothetical protein
MHTVLRLPSPSAFSAVPRAYGTLDFYDNDRLAGSVSCTSSAEAVLVRLDVGYPVVARGDLFDPAWRRWLATDVRLCHSRLPADRIDLLRMLSTMASAWDTYCQTPVSHDDVLHIAQEVERLRAERNGGGL